MKARYCIPSVLILCALLLAGCVSGERMVRNSPFDSSKFYREGVNLFPLYYQEGVNRSILFPLIDIDNRGFAVRPLYHRDRDEHGILWPLCAFNSKTGSGWAGTFFWNGKKNFGLLPLFFRDGKFWWVFPASWYAGSNYGVLPFFIRDEGNFIWALNVYKDKETFLIVPFYGQGKKWFYLLNFVRYSDGGSNTYIMIPLAFFTVDNEGKELLSPLFSFRTHNGELQMLNIAMLLYHYSGGMHRVFYPFFDINSGENHKEFWLWPLGYYGFNKHSEAPFFLFDYSDSDHQWYSKREIKIFSPLIFNYEYLKTEEKSTTRVLPWGALWYAENDKESFDRRILGGMVFRHSKSKNFSRFSLLYKLFSYHRFKGDVKWEFFPFVKIMKTARGDSWSFCWRLWEKHDGGGHIFFIPWGKREGK